MKKINNKYSVLVGFLCGIFLVVIIIYVKNDADKQSDCLKKEGINCKGKIIKKVYTKRGIDYKFTFFVNGNSINSWDKVECDLLVGDVVDIVYCKSNPKYYSEIICR
ncbi:MAG: hypothetical protein U0T77_05640 [Chitinophagales bacterium]